MNKKNIILISGLVIVLIVLGFLIISSRNKSAKQVVDTEAQKKSVENAEAIKAAHSPEAAAVEAQKAAIEKAKNQNRVIPVTKVEFMTSAERASLGISPETPNKFQVLARDGNGKVVSYKMIKTDSDIQTSF